MSSSKKIIWFHKARAFGWAILGGISFLLGLQNNVAMVWIASVYANFFTDWGAAEAADDRALQEQLQRIEAKLDRLLGDGDDAQRPPGTHNGPPRATS